MGSQRLTPLALSFVSVPLSCRAVLYRAGEGGTIRSSTVPSLVGKTKQATPFPMAGEQPMTANNQEYTKSRRQGRQEGNKHHHGTKGERGGSRVVYVNVDWLTAAVESVRSVFR